MNLTEIRKKTVKELMDQVEALKEKARGLRFQLASGKMKNTREIRSTKKDIAQLLTIVKEKEHHG